ncbi:MAG: hypothetical protein H0V14_12270 [Chitinophagaceae bacterium]|jgi:hypothetical protein|nr:hypothetical protein [Chitinophagaceae bacterium]
MISVLIFFLLKKYRLTGIKLSMMEETGLLIFWISKRIGIIVILLLLSGLLQAQEKTWYYQIIKNGDSVGSLCLQQWVNGNITRLKMVSEIEVRFLLKIKVYSIEEAIFQEGRLLFSSVYRKVNGQEKINKQTRALYNTYQLINDGKTATLNTGPILNNILTLYLREPGNLAKVYSDNHQQFVNLQKTGEHTYKVELPDGNYNFYSFQNGICTRAEVHHSLYKLQFVLTQQVNK